jgi:hypothetical protein
MLFLLSGLALAAPVELGVHMDTLTHPGVGVRSELPLAGKTLFLEGQALAYWHPELMTALELRAGPAIEHIGKRGGIIGAYAHVGVEHGFWTSPTYTVDNGDVQRARFTGDTWGVGAFGIELGHELERSRFASWSIRPELAARVPTFHGMGLDAAVEGTVRFGGKRS